MTDEDYLTAVLNCDDQSGMATDAAWRAVSTLRARAERAEAEVQRVRERAELRFGIPAVQGTYQAGYAAAMNDILRSLEGDSDE